jgi:hypothetical protein
VSRTTKLLEPKVTVTVRARQIAKTRAWLNAMATVRLPLSRLNAAESEPRLNTPIAARTPAIESVTTTSAKLNPASHLFRPSPPDRRPALYIVGWRRQREGHGRRTGN